MERTNFFSVHYTLNKEQLNKRKTSKPNKQLFVSKNQDIFLKTN